MKDFNTSDITKSLTDLSKKARALEDNGILKMMPNIRLFLDSIWNLCSATQAVQKNIDYVQANKLLESAEKGFEKLDEISLKDFATGLKIYTSGLIKLQEKNLDGGITLIEQAREYLRKAGNVANSFEQAVDQFQIDVYFLKALQSFSMNDYVSARISIRTASSSLEQHVDRYYKKNEPMYYTFQGLSTFYKSFENYLLTIQQFNNFDYDKIANNENLPIESFKAKKLLDKGDQGSLQFKLLSKTCESQGYLLEILVKLAQFLQGLFIPTFKPNMNTLKNIKQRLDLARNSALAAGDTAKILVKHCEQISNQVDNLERLVKEQIVESVSYVLEKEDRPNLSKFQQMQENALLKRVELDDIPTTRSNTQEQTVIRLKDMTITNWDSWTDGESDIYVITVVVDDQLQNPCNLELRSFSHVKKGDTLSIGKHGVMMYQRSGQIPTFLDIRVLVIRSKHKLREIGEMMENISTNENYKNAVQKLSSFITGPITMVISQIDTIVGIIGAILASKKDDQLLYYAGTLFNNIDKLEGLHEEKMKYVNFKYEISLTQSN